MNVFVIGGTGAIGRPVVGALLEAGHRVTALARTADKAARLRERGAETTLVSLFNKSGLIAAFEGQDAVVNLATSIPPTSRFMRAGAWAENDRIRKEGSAIVVDAARSADVARLVQESVVMIYPDRGAEWADEDVTPDRYPLAEGNLAAETNAAAFTETGRIGVVLRFGWFLGPGAAHSREMFTQASRHLGMVLGRPDSYVSSIHLDDAADAVIAALGVPGGIYNVVDNEPLTKRGYADALAAATGTSMWLRGPGRAAGLLGDRLTSLTRSVRATNQHFRETTAWIPRYTSAREGWAATAAALRDP